MKKLFTLLILQAAFCGGVFAQCGGTAQFTDSGQNLSVGGTDVAIDDLDGDGDMDVFVTTWNFNKVWLNDGSNSFTNNGQNLGNSLSYGVALADLDADGDIDAFVANTDANKVWLNDGAGNFTDNGQNLDTSDSRGVALADLDGDGDMDAFVVNYNQPNKIWLNDGAGSFTDYGQNLGNSLSYDVVLADLDGDGDMDAFVGNGGPNKVWLNDNTGNFSNSGQNLGNSSTLSVSLADLDGDGDMDAFEANSGWQPNKVWINDGAGTFTGNGQNLGNSSSVGLALAELDGDGDIDAFVGNINGQANKVWLNNGTGDFTDSGQNLGGSISYGVALADLDSDGDIDAFVANNTYDTNKVWLNINVVFPLCLITVDSTSTKNLVVWEKPITTVIDSFRIYREITTNNYQQVGNVHYSDVSAFFDNSLGVDPNVTSYRYKISVLETCGYESVLSDFHKTIHLIVSKDINNDPFLQWDDYEGFSVTSYRILIDSTGGNSWDVLATVPFGLTSYTDVNPPQIPSLRYIVEAVPPDTCTATKMGTNYNTTRSNTTAISTVPLSVSTSATDALEDSCDGTATVIAAGGTTPYTYVWNTTPVQTNATSTGLCPGTYTATVTDSDGTILTDSVTINEIPSLLPVANFVASAPVLFEGGATDFADLSTNNPTSWFWTFSYGTPGFSWDQHPTNVMYNAAGTYDVSLVATNYYGEGTLVKTGYITVSSNVGIEEAATTNSLLIYPNPFNQSSMVVFSNEEQASYELVICDVLGNKVRIVEGITSNEVLVEKGNLTPGVYFISLHGLGKAMRGKLMVE